MKKINLAIPAFFALALIALLCNACPNDSLSLAPASVPDTVTFTVTFDPDYGSWDGDFGNRTVHVRRNASVSAPDAPDRNFSVFNGWYTDRTGGERYNFAAPVTGPVTLYARWSIMFYFTDTDIVKNYLAMRPVNDADSPLFLPLIIDLGITTQADSGWMNLLNAIETAGKFVALDLSFCLANTEFDPDYTVSTGKERIVAIALPDGVEKIADGRRSPQSPAPEFYYDDPTFRYFDSLKSLSGKGLRSIGKGAFYGMDITLTSLPWGITDIGSSAFGHTGMTQITLPAGLQSIGSNAFYGCTGMTQISLPAGLQSIGSGAFSSCTGLTQISFPAGLQSIGDNAFYGCTGLTQITLPAGLQSIGGSAFSGCTGLTQISLPAGLQSIGYQAFYNCTGLTQITLPAGLQSIGGSAFSGCTGLTQISLPAGLQSIDGGAFSGCTGLTQISLPAGLQSIDGGAFYGCTGLTQISLPAELQSIGSNAFSGCTGLTQITLPAGLQSIGNSAFSGCTSLALVICLAPTPPTLSNGNLFNDAPNLQIKVPAAYIAAYREALYWRTFENISAM